MRLFILAGLLGAVCLGYAQPVTRLWIKTVAFPMTDAVSDMARDNAGNIYVCGGSVQDPGPRYAMMIAKFSPDGVKLWEKTYPGTSGQSTAYSIVIDPNGHPIVAGNTQFASGNGQSRILKASAATGAILYDVVGSAVDAQWYEVAVDSQGEASATGFINTGTGKVMRTSHFLSNGTLAWSRDYSYPGLSGAVDQHGAYIRVDSAGDIYVCGVHNNFPTNTFNTVVKYSRTSTQLWMRHFSPDVFNYPRGFSLAPGNKPTMGIHGSSVVGGNQTLRWVQYDTNGTQGTPKGLGFSGALVTAGFDTDPDGNTFWGGSSYVGGQLSSQFRAMVVPAIGVGYSITSFEPDLRALAAGRGGGDAYYATRALGPNAYPSTIYGYNQNAPFRQWWQEKIFGSTANGQIPTATVTNILVDPVGDVYVTGNFSGAVSQDIFLVKYETGPIAEDDLVESQANITVNSPPKGFLANDGQLTQASLTFLSLPRHGAFTPSPDGTYTYVPDTGFAGRDRAFYRFTRTNGTAPRETEAMIEFTIYPNLTGASFDPLTVKSGNISFLTATCAQAPNTDVPLKLFNYPIWMRPLGTLSIWKDRKYGKLMVDTDPLGSTQVGSILVQSGVSSTTATLTVTP